MNHGPRRHRLFSRTSTPKSESPDHNEDVRPLSILVYSDIGTWIGMKNEAHMDLPAPGRHMSVFSYHVYNLGQCFRTKDIWLCVPDDFPDPEILNICIGVIIHSKSCPMSMTATVSLCMMDCIRSAQPPCLLGLISPVYFRTPRVDVCSSRMQIIYPRKYYLCVAVSAQILAVPSNGAMSAEVGSKCLHQNCVGKMTFRFPKGNGAKCPRKKQGINLSWYDHRKCASCRNT